MKAIKLLKDIPVDKKHGAVKDKIYVHYEFADKGVWIEGAAGEKVKVLPNEFEYVEVSDNE